MNYDNLCVEVEVDYENYKKIDTSTRVEVEFDGVVYEGGVTYIDYVMNNDTVKVMIETDVRCLLGTNVDVRFVYQEEKEYLCVPTEFITMQGGNFYVQINVGTDREPELENGRITVGKMFEKIEDGHVSTFYEVLRGLQTGDKIYMKIRAGEKIE